VREVRATTGMCRGGREAQLCNSTLPRAAGECEGGRVAQLREGGTDACRGPRTRDASLRGRSVVDDLTATFARQVKDAERRGQ